MEDEEEAVERGVMRCGGRTGTNAHPPAPAGGLSFFANTRTQLTEMIQGERLVAEQPEQPAMFMLFVLNLQTQVKQRLHENRYSDFLQYERRAMQ